MDISDFLSTLVKGSNIDLPYLGWYTLRNSILPDINLEREKQ